MGEKLQLKQHCPHPDLLQVAPFEAIIDEELEPGDILYIPPGFPHEGYALENAMNYSVGFRAPMTRFSEQVADLAMSCTAQRQLNDGLRDRLLEAGARIEQNERAMRELSRRLSACREELASAQRNLAETDNLLRRTQVDRDDTHARLLAILDSRFWRFTKPLRNLSRLFGSETGCP